MRYQGGKGKLAKVLAPLILDFAGDRRIVEPFHGGLAMTAALHPAVAGDYSAPVARLVEAVRGGWMPPMSVSEEEYREAAARRENIDDPLVCFIGQCATFGGKWWGGYARPHPNDPRPRNTAARTLLKRIEETRDTFFVHKPYWEFEVLPGDVVYCDPPYKDTSQDYPTPPFDHDRFWSWVQEIAEDGADVFVSEFTAPEGVSIFWEKEVATQTRKVGAATKVERLYHVPAKETEDD